MNTPLTPLPSKPFQEGDRVFALWKPGCWRAWTIVAVFGDTVGVKFDPAKLTSNRKLGHVRHEDEHAALCLTA